MVSKLLHSACTVCTASGAHTDGQKGELQRCDCPFIRHYGTSTIYLLHWLQSEEEGLKVKQEEMDEAAQQPDHAAHATAEAASNLVFPVQNGEGDSLNLSAGFIQVHSHPYTHVH